MRDICIPTVANEECNKEDFGIMSGIEANNWRDITFQSTTQPKSPPSFGSKAERTVIKGNARRRSHVSRSGGDFEAHHRG